MVSKLIMAFCRIPRDPSTPMTRIIPGRDKQKVLKFLQAWVVKLTQDPIKMEQEAQLIALHHISK